MEEKKRLAEMHMKARYDAGKSQEYVALEMGVSKKTVANWEKGVSTPDIFDSINWFRVLGLNPMPYYLNFMFPTLFEVVNSASKDEDVEILFEQLVENLTINNKRALLYLFYGNHGSSPNAVVQLILAHLHTPIKDRVLHAEVIAREFEMEKELGNIICKDNIMPDMDVLNSAIQNGRSSALSGEFGYAMGVENEENEEL